MERKPFLTDAIIGNSSMLVSLTKDGQARRLTWPNIDFPQHLNRFYVGVRGFEGSTQTQYLHDSIWNHEQAYVGSTNILETVSSLPSVGLSIRQLDFVLPDSDVYVRNFTFRNLSNRTKNLSMVVFSDFMIDEKERYQTVFYDEKADCMVHYHREYAFAVGADHPIAKLQCGASLEDIREGRFYGKRVMNRSYGGFEFEPMEIAPLGESSITLLITAGHGDKQAIRRLNHAKDTSFAEHLTGTYEYWINYLHEAEPIEMKDERIKAIYQRSLLMFHLMNNKNGGFIAGPECDEDYLYSGGYSYCWGRDAAFTATAYSLAGYHSRVKKFFQWIKGIQEEDGSWDQRYYMDGHLAPAWGLQIDETGSILWGMQQHYQVTQDEEFLDEIWPAVEKAADFLTRFIDPNTKLPMPSKDIWEKRDGEHFYSTSAVYGGLMGAALFADKKNETEKATFYRKVALEMKATVLDQGFNEERKAFYRGLYLTLDEPAYLNNKAQGKEVAISKDSKGYPIYQLVKDDVVDICLLGLHVPFGMIEANHPKMKQTAATLEELCTSKIVGGIERFPGDIYITGDPWILTTLWLAIYYTRIDKHTDARRLLNWVVNHATELDLLPEQIDKITGKPAWVLPLTWSHAMFILTVHEMRNKGIEL